jgi:hypothetical protein
MFRPNEIGLEAEVVKLKIVYLQHISIRLTLFTLDFWEGRGRRHNVLFIESEKFDP